MSEINTDNSIEEQGIPEITLQLEVQQTVQAPVDPTLSIEGEAADAKATGDAIAAAQTALQEEIDTLGGNITTLVGTLFPVGCIYVSTSASAPTFGGANWNWEEILVPVTQGDLMDGSRSYKTKESGDTPGTLHFWRRIADASGVSE